MNTTMNWEEPTRKMERLLRLRSFPVAFKMLANRDQLNDIPYLRRPSGRVTLCQLITQVRNFDWTVGATAEDFVSPMCATIVGFSEVPEYYTDGTFRNIVWFRTKEDGRKFETTLPRLPLNAYEAVVMAPLVYNPFDPDIILVYGNPAQMMILINALQFEDYQVMEFFCVGESSCADVIVRSIENNKPYLSIPCYGERRYGHAQDDELVMAIPADQFAKAVRGLETLYRRGIRYPICHAGAEQDLSNAFPPAYGSMDRVKKVRGDDGRLVLGVTGGIAGGKTTVANMLAELGAPIIDFDILAREVVEPGQPAYDDIVTYFSRQVLLEDQTLDRKAISDIVFSDLEKRKKLESFTHPRIYELFFRRLDEITAANPKVIVQAVVPLLLELNMQYLFHKILLVYVPREVQVERLMARDNITREQAEKILKAQLPLEEKQGYADYIINNSGSLEETQKEVLALWPKLQEAMEGINESS